MIEHVIERWYASYVNGVDIIRCNDEGRIIEFRVMIRPLQAVNLVHHQWRQCSNG